MPVVEKIELEELLPVSDPQGSALVARDMNLIGHVTVEIVAEVGTACLSVSQLFALTAGEVVALRQSVQDPVLLRLNGKPIARGELVAVDDNIGIQITEML